MGNAVMLDLISMKRDAENLSVIRNRYFIIIVLKDDEESVSFSCFPLHWSYSDCLFHYMVSHLCKYEKKIYKVSVIIVCS